MKPGKCRNLFEVPLIINSGENIRSTVKEMTEVLSVSDHKEAQRTLNFQAETSIEATVYIAKYTYSFLPLIYTLGKFSMESLVRLNGIY